MLEPTLLLHLCPLPFPNRRRPMGMRSPRPHLPTTIRLQQHMLQQQQLKPPGQTPTQLTQPTTTST